MKLGNKISNVRLKIMDNVFGDTSSAITYMVICYVSNEMPTIEMLNFVNTMMRI